MYRPSHRGELVPDDPLDMILTVFLAVGIAILGGAMGGLIVAALC